MRKNKSFAVLLVFLFICINFFTLTVYADSKSSIAIELDKTDAKVGDLIKASIKINNIENFSGYQVNLRYNPQVLEAVNPESGEKYNEKTVPGNNDILLNDSFSPISLVDNLPSGGILNFARSYLNLSAYKNSGKPENTGTVAVIGFKVLKDAATEIIFEDLGTMPGSNEGTLLFDWDAAQIKSGYTVIHSPKINPNSESAPMPEYTKKGGTSASQPKTDGNNNKTFVVIILVAVILLIIIALVFLLRGNKKKEDGSYWLDGNGETQENPDEIEDEDGEDKESPDETEDGDSGDKKESSDGIKEERGTENTDTGEDVQGTEKK